jgi:dynein heavy chain
MNTVLTQEIIRYVKSYFLLLFIFNYFIRYNKLLNTIHTSLQELLKAMKGLVVLSQGLEEMSKSLFNNSVPVMWSKAVCFYFY